MVQRCLLVSVLANFLWSTHAANIGILFMPSILKLCQSQVVIHAWSLTAAFPKCLLH